MGRTSRLAQPSIIFQRHNNDEQLATSCLFYPAAICTAQRPHILILYMTIIQKDTSPSNPSRALRTGNDTSPIAASLTMCRTSNLSTIPHCWWLQS
jgi:hypothetical protein